jgi:hypothetical protein
VGSTPGKERKREFVDNANGLYSAQASPKPPPALYTITEGMRVGGKVPSELLLLFSGLLKASLFFPLNSFSLST